MELLFLCRLANDLLSRLLHKFYKIAMVNPLIILTVAITGMLGQALWRSSCSYLASFSQDQSTSSDDLAAIIWTRPQIITLTH